MANTEFSRIVIRRPDGKCEVLGRRGFHDPHRTARDMEAAGKGVVISVRHERTHPAGHVETVAIHALQP